MRNPGVVRFPLISLPDEMLPKLIDGFRQSDCEICRELVKQLGLEARRRASNGFAAVEIELPFVSPGDNFDARTSLLECAASMLSAADADGNTIENPSGYQLCAEFVLEVVHALERMELCQLSAATNAVN